MSMDIEIQGTGVSNVSWNFKGEVDYVDNWLLMGNPMPMILILMGYLTFVLKVGPEYMKNRPAYSMTNVITLYNISQILLSFYLCYIASKLVFSNGFIASSCMTDSEYKTYLTTTASHIYFLAKVSELLDTVFFVLRKNVRQITFLHVYHHSIMILIPWFVLKYEPSYTAVFVGCINSYVHVVMYTYYFLSVFPELTKYLWWKKYITKMQITQFICIILHAAVNHFYSDCPSSYTILVSIVSNAILFTILFTKFYINTYKKVDKVK